MSVRTPVDIIGDEAVAALMAEGWAIRRSATATPSARDGECPVCVPHPVHAPNACRICGDCPGPEVSE